MATKRYDTSKGRWYDTPDGMFPSVTRILEETESMAFLMPWAVGLERIAVTEVARRIYEQNAGGLSSASFALALQQALPKEREHQRISREALEIGSRVHKHLSHLMGGENGTEPLADVEQHAVNEGLRWAEDNGFKPLATEMVVWNPEYKYAGTLDTYGPTNECGITVVDYKTSKQLKPRDELQVIAYAVALGKMIDQPVLRACVVRLPKDGKGKYEVRDLSRLRDEFESRWIAFRAARHLWGFNNDRENG